MSSVKGGCACGAVRYECWADPIMVCGHLRVAPREIETSVPISRFNHVSYACLGVVESGIRAARRDQLRMRAFFGDPILSKHHNSPRVPHGR